MTAPRQGRFLVGLDVGSTTIKAVAVEAGSAAIAWKDYRRHETRQAEMAFDFLSRMEKEVGIREGNARLFVTGSGGAALADLLGARFVQEVNAVSLAVEKDFPDVHSVVELGGQDAKILIFEDEPATGARKKLATMNDKCAGGTGAVLDKLGAKLGIAPAALGRLGWRDQHIHRVAGKCGVFAETDINSLQKQGVPPEELMASLFEAIVLQNLTVLTRGRTLFPRVLLLGGPNTFIRGMREAWQEHIPRMWAERRVAMPSGATAEQLIFVPENSQYFAAIGAVEFGREQEESVGAYAGLRHLDHYLREGHHAAKTRDGQPALARSGMDLAEFRRRYTPSTFRPPALAAGETVRAFLGIDAGSTSTKAVLLDEAGAVLAKAYRLSQGNPIQDAKDLVGKLRGHVQGQGARLEILGVGTTGYAKNILHRVLRADVALVETVAHARSAIQRYRNPDVIVDVGGQDIKLILLKDGNVKDFMLNTQCSAGNGYFLQATAQGFGLDVGDYAEAAFSAEWMPEFTYGCAIFLQADIVNFQRNGWTRQQILAGLAAVLPKNIWLHVAKIPNLSGLGRRFLLQGGTQRNLAAVKAQVDYIRARFARAGVEPEIIVHEHCGEAGAIGAALEAARLQKEGRHSSFIGLDAVANISYRATTDESTRCVYCTNRCLRTFIDFRVDGDCADAASAGDGGRTPAERFIVATCEKGSAGNVAAVRAVIARIDEVKRNNPNLVDVAARTAFKPQKPAIVADPLPARSWSAATRKRLAAARGRGNFRIGIPRVLNFYTTAPFFSAYFESLGVPAENVVFSDVTTDALYREGARRGSIDPCFPSKVVIAHIHNLLEKHHRRRALDCIFLPMIDSLETFLSGTLGANACPTTIAAPQAAAAAFTAESDVFAEKGVRFLNPIVHLADRKWLTREMLEIWGGPLGLSEAENERAVSQGILSRERWDRELRRKGRDVIDMLEHERRLGVVMLGRPYHHDPGLNHGIFEEFQKLGYPVLSQNTLPLDEDLLDRLFGDEVRAGLVRHPLDISDVWKHAYSTSTSHKIWAAKFTARHPHLIGVEISSFKCGHDAPTYRLLQSVIESAGRPYFGFRDIDENKPVGSIRIRVETIHYFLERHREEVIRNQIALEEIEHRLQEYEALVLAGANANRAASHAVEI
jgi:activator of 2-hydroxyglutaryl-CoA dehydratase/predicted nucleotide-binding protein (sugar kinase/HSP70/actin superfamily)